MPLIYAGIDEAGYGPLLGPLCVGMAAFRVDDWAEGAAAPDLWDALSAAVCREGRDPKRRIAVDDSKKLKGSNSSTTRHPLTHLERGVLSFLAAMDTASDPPSHLDTSTPRHLSHDLDFFARVGVKAPAESWYAGEPAKCPASTSPEAIGIAANGLRIALEGAKIQPIALRCQAMGEGVFNELVGAAGTKAAATEAALTEHLWTIWDRWGTIGAESGGGVRVICDRQGGRSYYTEVLSRAFPGVAVAQTHHSETQSRYELSGKGTDGVPRHMHVLFLVESEQHHLPVALASMLAKLTRETLMARFNRYWCARMPELKPTAGYRNDAWRWLEEAKGVIAEGERAALMRRA
ncbi:MAG TPA: hypothetical protein PKE29_04410 [Phycisphaerales bacterium]|nr:hypothetical protein [Phycisphaerales bacterium]